MDDQSFDAVVTTWTLCSVSDIAVALREMQRVLKPGGTLVFAEHGTAPNIAVRTWQDRLTPLWKRIAGGGHLNRKPDARKSVVSGKSVSVRVGHGGRSHIT